LLILSMPPAEFSITGRLWCVGVYSGKGNNFVFVALGLKYVVLGHICHFNNHNSCGSHQNTFFPSFYCKQTMKSRILFNLSLLPLSFLLLSLKPNIVYRREKFKTEKIKFNLIHNL
jgi:hypothetical protein